MVFTPSAQRIPTGPGTLYAAPLGTAEPTSVSGAWPANWAMVGYTDKGNDRSFKPSFQAVEVDEEIDPVRQASNGRAITVAFSMAEITAQNLSLAYNAGIGSALLASTTGIYPDGSVWVEPPAPGQEVTIMLGWDALPQGATSPGAFGYTLGRTVYRQCLQTGEVKSSMQKGNQKKLWTVTFTLIKPPGVEPLRDIFPASVAQ